MSKAASMSVTFRERRANLSTRLSARGHRFEFSEQDDLHASLQRQIRDMCQAVVLAEAIGTADAMAQVNRLRGKLGNFRQIIRGTFKGSTADIFMAAARELLPQHVFDELLIQTRWLRSREAEQEIATIDTCLSRARAERAP